MVSLRELCGRTRQKQNEPIKEPLMIASQAMNMHTRYTDFKKELARVEEKYENKVIETFELEKEACMNARRLKEIKLARVIIHTDSIEVVFHNDVEFPICDKSIGYLKEIFGLENVKYGLYKDYHGAHKNSYTTYFDNEDYRTWIKLS